MNGNGGGISPSAGDDEGAAVDARLDPLQPARADESRQSLLPGLLADPERARRADHRAQRGEQRVQPEQLRLARRHDDHDEVDAERQEEHHRRVEDAHEDDADGREEVAEDREEERAHARLTVSKLKPIVVTSGQPVTIVSAWESLYADGRRSPCSAPAAAADRMPWPKIAREYVRLVLAMGQHDKDYVDAYYGPADIKKEAEGAKLTLDAHRHAASTTLAGAARGRAGRGATSCRGCVTSISRSSSPR